MRDAAAAASCFFGIRRCKEMILLLRGDVVILEECVEIMLSMISDSMDAWSTRQYDFYQRVLNGIL